MEGPFPPAFDALQLSELVEEMGFPRDECKKLLLEGKTVSQVIGILLNDASVGDVGDGQVENVENTKRVRKMSRDSQLADSRDEFSSSFSSSFSGSEDSAVDKPPPAKKSRLDMPLSPPSPPPETEDDDELLMKRILELSKLEQKQPAHADDHVIQQQIDQINTSLNHLTTAQFVQCWEEIPNNIDMTIQQLEEKNCSSKPSAQDSTHQKNAQYGALLPLAVEEVMRLAKLKPTETLLDIGSG